MKIVRSEPKYHQELSGIAKKSKAFWGYSRELMEFWDDDLTISEDYILKNEVFHLVSEDYIEGFYSYFKEDKNTVRLDYMFINPDSIGKGFGKLLMEDFLDKMKNSETGKIILDADPNAEKFYEKFGFERVELKPTKITNRFLPVMVKILKNIIL